VSGKPSAGRRVARRGSLTIVGTGISGVNQMTMEAVRCVEQAERLFYVVVDPITERWLRTANPTATTLTDLYGEEKPRAQTYAQMTARIVQAVRDGHHVCAAFYGHPGILARSTHDAIRRLRRQGYPTRMLPGVSADGCLVADVGADLAERGTQSYEATTFLYWRHRVDPTSHLILWQIGSLGSLTGQKRAACPADRLQTLAARLMRDYPRDHKVMIYRAASSPLDRASMRRMPLHRLPSAQVGPMTLLFVPALENRRRPSAEVSRWFTNPRAAGTRTAG
jgi:uncharacterized protein YabN with tetrapyrrole methylase and pyrophosphatase domain